MRRAWRQAKRFHPAQMEAHMFGDGDSSTHYFNGMSAKRHREETEEERATY
jgi:hypothetical protein